MPQCDTRILLPLHIHKISGQLNLSSAMFIRNSIPRQSDSIYLINYYLKDWYQVFKTLKCLNISTCWLRVEMRNTYKYGFPDWYNCHWCGYLNERKSSKFFMTDFFLKYPDYVILLRQCKYQVFMTLIQIYRLLHEIVLFWTPNSQLTLKLTLKYFLLKGKKSVPCAIFSIKIYENVLMCSGGLKCVLTTCSELFSGIMTFDIHTLCSSSKSW